VGRTNHVISNLVGGEISPFCYGRIDLPLYTKSLAKMENFLPLPQGGARYRPGTNFVHFTRRMQDAVFIPFQFNAAQSYLIEATQGFFRFYANQGVITGNDPLITAMTNASPGVFTTAVAHGFYVGQVVTLTGMSGTNIVDGTQFTVASTSFTATTFSLLTLPGGTPFNTTSIGTFVPNGHVVGQWAITGMTNTKPVTLTIPNHPFAVGDELFISGIVDQFNSNSINGYFYLVSAVTTGASGTVTLTDLFGNTIDATVLASYVSGGTAARVLEIRRLTSLPTFLISNLPS
jgi:hypothetical protein